VFGRAVFIVCALSWVIFFGDALLVNSSNDPLQKASVFSYLVGRGLYLTPVALLYAVLLALLGQLTKRRLLARGATPIEVRHATRPSSRASLILIVPLAVIIGVWLLLALVSTNGLTTSPF